MLKGNIYYLMKNYSITTPSLRQLSLIDYKIFSRLGMNYFRKGKETYSGRNHSGHITVRHRGGRLSRLYTTLDQFDRKFNIPFSICSLEYDSYRSSFISLIRYSNGVYCYRLSIYKNFIGDSLMSHSSIPETIKNGDGFLLKYAMPGSLFCNLELRPLSGFQLTKSAGAASLLLKKEYGRAYLKLCSGSVKLLSMYSSGFLGSISNKNYRYTVIGKAGGNVMLGRRPSVRGVAMNPVDHPHGGGEGKKSKRSFPRSPWGKRFKKHKKIITVK